MTKFFDIFTGERIAFNLDFGRGMKARYEQALLAARAKAEDLSECHLRMPSDDPDFKLYTPVVKQVEQLGSLGAYPTGYITADYIGGIWEFWPEASHNDRIVWCPHVGANQTNK